MDFFYLLIMCTEDSEFLDSEVLDSEFLSCCLLHLELFSPFFQLYTLTALLSSRILVSCAHDPATTL